MKGRLPLCLWSIALFTIAASAGCKRPQEIVVFHASSLRRALFDAAQDFERANAGTRVRLEPSGSQVAARKVVELGLFADLVMVSDVEVIDRLLVPRFATWNAEFATNEIVLAHKDHSRFTDEVITERWAEVLLREGVRVGRANPETAPLGYQTLFAWQLAERSDSKLSGLVERLSAQVKKEHVASDETELMGLLEARAIDYAFLYRSTAEDHHLKITSLPTEQNLSSRELRPQYAVAEVELGPKKQRLEGGPILYGLTIPTNAKNPAGGARFAAFLLGPAGRRALERAGLKPLQPAPCRRATAIPPELQSLVSPSP